jgi:DNA-binding transcriptional LysR family regulator
MSDLNRLSFQHLLFLQALVEERHVTRAAERMGIGQPHMSSVLARLRVVFRDVLLVKTSSGMEPTARALEVVKRIRDMSELLEGRGLSDEQFKPSETRAHWRIMASDGIARLLIPSLMEVAEREVPYARFTVQPGDPRRLAEYLRESDFDLVLGFVRSPPMELRQLQLYPQRLVCIARCMHPTIHGSLSLQQFERADHAKWSAPPVAYATLEAMVDEAMEKLGQSRRVKLHVSSLALLPEVVARSNLLAVVPERMALDSKERCALQVLPIPLSLASVDVSMLWHDRLHQDPAHKWLRDTLRDIGQRTAESFLTTPASHAKAD